MNSITANELKTRGVSAVEDRLQEADEAFISVRGKDRFVVIRVDQYARLRDFELEMAIREARADYEAGRVHRESIEDHLERVADGL
jgi:PHD/YefM family antitoxin component YafN of YafNO toxin-antitoxin module